MKANNNSNSSSTTSRATLPNPPEENGGILSYGTVLAESYRQAGGSSPSPPLPFMQSGNGVTNREHLLAILNEALVIISDSASSDFVSDRNSLGASSKEDCSRHPQ
jgi:hypothetical protein